MGWTEYVLLALVILIPAVLAVAVTLWSLKQASLRSAKGRKRWQPPVPRPVNEEPPAVNEDAASKTT